jgi:hypothetical protein
MPMVSRRLRRRGTAYCRDGVPEVCRAPLQPMPQVSGESVDVDVASPERAQTLAAKVGSPEPRRTLAVPLFLSEG